MAAVLVHNRRNRYNIYNMKKIDIWSKVAIYGADEVVLKCISLMYLDFNRWWS